MKYLLLVSSLGLLSSCILAPEKKTSTEPNPTTSTQPTSTTTTSTKEIPSSCEFHTYGAYLPFDNYGIHISDQLSGRENRDKLINSINTQVGKELVTSISADGCNIQTDDGTSNKNHLHLTVGGGSDNGYIEFNLSISFIKIEVAVIAYYKGEYSLDTDSLIDIDGDSHAIPNDPSASTQQEHKFEKTYSGSPKKFKLSNHGEKQRFFLESVTLFY